MDENEKEEICKQVKQFLKEIKNLIYENGLYIKDRRVNRDALLEMGLTPEQREEIVLNLTILDYCSGPHPDSLTQGVYWIFGNKIGITEVYIKLKIAGQFGEEQALYLSFHKAEKPLNYPLSNQ